MAKLQIGEEAIWCKRDLPLNQRVPKSFLLGLRRQLITWGLTGSNIRVKDDNHTVTVEGNPVLKATVAANRLTLEWMSQDWKDWKELIDSSEFKKLVEKADEALQKAAEARGKGNGKGKNGH